VPPPAALPAAGGGQRAVPGGGDHHGEVGLGAGRIAGAAPPAAVDPWQL